jgi:hypothetical protein
MHPCNFFNQEELEEIRREELLGLKPGQALNVRNGAGEWGQGRVIALDIRQGEVCFVAVVPVEGQSPIGLTRRISVTFIRCITN